MSDGIGVGYGARPYADGIDAVYFVAQENYPVEFLEPAIRCACARYGILAIPAAPGRYRGGCGIVREYEILAEEAVLAIRIDSVKNPPWGIAGGMAGGTGRAWSIPARRTSACWRRCRTATCCKHGDILRIETGGGGGHGHPFDRPAEHVLQDVLGGFVSVEAAARHYGVVARRRLRVDEAATAALRADAAGDQGVPPPRLCRQPLADHASLAVAVDIGGTFTDIALYDRRDRPASGAPRRRACRPIPVQAFLAGVRLALDEAGAQPHRRSAACCTARPSPPT